MSRIQRSETTEDGRKRNLSRPPAPEPLPAPVTDTHCHMDIVDGPDGDTFGPDEALAAAADVGVSRVVQVGVDLPSSAMALDMAQRYSNVVATVAVHPNEAPRLAGRGELTDALSRIDELAGAGDTVRGVGETGLDHFRTTSAGFAPQEESFRGHIEIARRRDLALVIHDRDAHGDILRVLDDADLPDRVVFHCFSGDAEMARHCAERGWFLSFAGPITFKNSQALRSALKVTPLDQVLVETDAPFLTPHPHRGRPNASYLVPLTVRTIADVLERDLETVCNSIQANTNRALGAW
ncbi:TatD family hydrolase [Phytoactinopolyspora mesophila]|uniref:YchF/TatD family DNA exonuclease n=1 Tax=Phytoactinopolyspora mesophila TaxID=2650750 RepID=A0A7K3M559_9ACTN|nr:TatD family hydrolase [Phytoactinopolyspora mesophila]NDL58449.1 YchF/TatD family DNA exonuclease [Phytoactinopolyspora mesophila]